MKEKISIIIPVYNAKDYLKRCLDSILNSTYKNIEIILLDDGSTDNSLEICNNYQKKYKDIIKVYSHKNMGVGKTRNKGITLATGKYIMFMDNDDFITEDYIENYYNEISNDNLDVVIGGYERVDEQNKVILKSKLKDYEWSRYKIVSPWAKIYNLNYLRNNNIIFLDSNIGEDIYFNIQVINMTDKIKIINDTSYKWFYNTKSISNTIHKKADKNLEFEYLLDKTYKKLKSINKEKEQIIEYFFMKTICWYIIYITNNTPIDIVKKEKTYYLNWLEKHYPNYQKNKYLKLWKPKGESLKNKVVVYLIMKGYKYHFDNLILNILQ